MYQRRKKADDISEKLTLRILNFGTLARNFDKSGLEEGQPERRDYSCDNIGISRTAYEQCEWSISTSPTLLEQ